MSMECNIVVVVVVDMEVDVEVDYGVDVNGRAGSLTTTSDDVCAHIVETSNLRQT